jgi:hypothetical protein
LYRGVDHADLKKIYSEHNLTRVCTFPDFLDAYNKATEERHSFLYVRDDKNHVEMRKNFDQPFVSRKVQEGEDGYVNETTPRPSKTKATRNAECSYRTRATQPLIIEL